MEKMASTLEVLLNRATDVRNSASDTTAAHEFCSVINKEPCCAHIAARVLANKIQSPEEWEALQGLNLIDTCMKLCGVIFHAEVGKFRFLNEMIKLVSPKYLGGRTAPAVRRRVLQLMHAWTIDYPRETKIRDAYDMLKKQGVVKEESSYNPSVFSNCAGPGSPMPPPPPRRSANTIFEDEERSRLLQKLLQSKNPDDLQAANRLIKTMVKEDERRVEINSRRITELESVHNNARLLSEMLDSYRPGQSSQEELELIKELHQSCERLRPNVFQLASETQDNEAMLNEVLNASDELGQVFDKYTAVIIQGKSVYIPPKTNNTTSLLDLSTPSEEKLPPVPVELLSNQLSNLGLDLNTQSGSKTISKGASISSTSNHSNLDDIGDLFASIEPVAKHVSPTSPVHAMLQPTTIPQAAVKSAGADIPDAPEKNSKLKALEDLDILGETMLKQSLPTSCKMGSQFTKPPGKVPMNLLSKPTMQEQEDAVGNPPGSGDAAALPLVKPTSSLDLDFLIGGGKTCSESSHSDLLNGDDSMVDLSEEGEEIYTEVTLGEHKNGPSVMPSTNAAEVSSTQSKINSVAPESARKESVQVTKTDSSANIDNMQSRSSANTPVKKVEVQPLTDISVSLDNIKPGSLPPLTAMEERNGVSVILHFASNALRPDVSVIVVTTMSKNSSTLTHYLFQAVVPKTCKLRLLPPSATELPAHSPFLPPSAITQIMLIANPNKNLISLKFIVSYTMDDETVTEMGEVDQLPLTT